MNNNIQTSEFIWRGLNVRVSFTPEYSKGFEEIYGYPLSHLEIMAINPERAPLPFTETGYKSCFLSPEDVETSGGPVAYVRAWLDYAAKSSFWIIKEEAAKQMSLF